MVYRMLLLYHQNCFENVLTQRVHLFINLCTIFKHQHNNQQKETEIQF
jgi:hypothetical protein